MRRVTGLGGVFFKAEHPEQLYQWYEKHFGIKRAIHGQGATFLWRDDGDAEGSTAWAIFPKDTEYFQSSQKSFLLNYRIENLDALLDTPQAEGVWIDPKREDYDYGRFAWIMDPEGNRIELWEPPKRV